jgi:hypothetical protein
MSAQSQPATATRRPVGRPVGSRHVRAVMREKLIAAYVAALGGADRISPIQLQDVERAVDLVLLARDMRASVRQGSAKVSDLTRLEGAADRAVRRLNLPAASTAAPAQSFADYLAQPAATTDEGDG